ncbi:K(+)-transporting ATPase subunit F [Pseudoroseomonas aestuarii]|uniref:K(+)-transporting ATPase subunit F n=1 Tax=Teichococcus aestuarii TaxID=568898 RepID=A0A2U1UZI7_9PROT|nr:K(+)-transporting ATPase subunit F [Pseudoroseomonas aestuarii]
MLIFMDFLCAGREFHIASLRRPGLSGVVPAAAFARRLPFAEHPHDRPPAAGAGPRLLRPDGGLRRRLRPDLTAMPGLLDLMLGGAVSLGLLGYLLWALLRPEDL